MEHGVTTIIAAITIIATYYCLLLSKATRYGHTDMHCTHPKLPFLKTVPLYWEHMTLRHFQQTCKCLLHGILLPESEEHHCSVESFIHLSLICK